MITFDKIIIEGFGSIIKRTTYLLNRVGLNLILGKNGSGKTSLINAICWNLYKQVSKKNSTIEPWP